MTDTDRVTLRGALEERYLSYALSTITGRALSDVRDGLKPGQRRLLYAMRRMGMTPEGVFRKSARVVGDVIGRFHPHGDQASYDALTRMAQGFLARYPLVEGHGNFGSLDGDSAAAMRYTECRLTRWSWWMLEGLDEDAVDFVPTYDGLEKEPVVAPGLFPNFLANGSSGIAVGMASSCPPHNAGELCRAALGLLKARTSKERSEALLEVKGPDFPGGGSVADTDDLVRAAYESGRGSFRVRATWEEEKEGSLLRAVITELPWLVKKGVLMERVDLLLREKKLPLVGDMRDESGEEVRIVVEGSRRGVSLEEMMESLYSATALESRIMLNMNALDEHGSPRVFSLGGALDSWLEHCRAVVERRARSRLEEVRKRTAKLEGWALACLKIEEVVAIIRENDEPALVLMSELGMTSEQAEGVLELRLRSLRKLEEMRIRKELGDLEVERRDLEKTISGKAAQKRKVRSWLKELEGYLKKSGDKRRTRMEPAELGVSAAAATSAARVLREPVTALCSRMGWVRVVAGHVRDAGSRRWRDGDGLRFAALGMSDEAASVFGGDGRFYTLRYDDLPGGRGLGEPLRKFVDLPEGREVAAFFAHDEERRLLLASAAGYGFIVKGGDTTSFRRAGKKVLDVGEGEARICVPCDGDAAAFLSEDGRLLLAWTSEVPQRRSGRGVRLQRISQGGSLAYARVFRSEEGLDVTPPEGRRRKTYGWGDLEPWRRRRGGVGRLVPRGWPREGGLGDAWGSGEGSGEEEVGEPGGEGGED